MKNSDPHSDFSGAAKVWEDFAKNFSSGESEDFGFESSSDEFRDEYVRLPYDDIPISQECCW